MELAQIPCLRGVAATVGPAQEAAVVASALVAINSLPAVPLALACLWRRARGSAASSTSAEEPSGAAAEKERRNRRWALGIFFGLLLGYASLALTPTCQRPALMQSRLWRWWLEYFSVRVVHRGGKPLPAGQYFYCFVPHGLYPFSGAMACVSKLVDVFPRMRMIVAPVGMRVPMIRQLMGWIGCILANRSSIRAALGAGHSVAVFPGGIAEMVRTDGSSERLVLQSRKGFVKLALEHGVPIVPVYVFGQSLLWSHLRVPGLEALSRVLRASLILPYGRFGLLVPRRMPLLYAIGEPINAAGCSGTPTPDQVDSTHRAVVESIQDLYECYKGAYGWGARKLVVD